MPAAFRPFVPLLVLSLVSCTCSRDPAAERDAEEAETGELAEDGPESSTVETAPEASPPAEAPAGPAAARTRLEVVSAEALKEKLRGSGRRGTLVNAWASFCGPCKREIPMLEGVAKKLRARGLDVVLVSVDEPGDEAKALAFLAERGVELESYLAGRPLGPFKMGMNPRWPGMLPASFLFDAEGRLRYFWGGEAYESEILPVLEDFLAGRPMQGESTPAVAPDEHAQ